MSRRTYRSRRDSLGSVVVGSPHLAAKLGPRGALVVGAIGFAVFYVALPFWLSGWTHANSAQLTGSAGQTFAHAIDLALQQRIVSPCRWVGLAIPLACLAVALWKAFDQPELDADDIERAS